MKLIPRGDRVIIKLRPVEERKYGSLYIPDKHSEPSRIADVMAVGPDVKYYLTGDRVVVGYWSGIVVEFPEFKVSGDCLRVVREAEILAVIEEENVDELRY